YEDPVRGRTSEYPHSYTRRQYTSGTDELAERVRLMKRLVTGIVIVVAALVTMASAQQVLDVYAVYATAIEEPWDGVIHTALLDAEAAGLITYEFVDDIGYAGDMERIMREV